MRAFLKALPAQATQPNTTAVGQQATAFGANSSALRQLAVANGVSSTAIGQSANANLDYTTPSVPMRRRKARMLSPSASVPRPMALAPPRSAR